MKLVVFDGTPEEVEKVARDLGIGTAGAVPEPMPIAPVPMFRSRRKVKKHSRWTADEDGMLKNFVDGSGKRSGWGSVRKLARKLGRTYPAVKARLQELRRGPKKLVAGDRKNRKHDALWNKRISEGRRRELAKKRQESAPSYDAQRARMKWVHSRAKQLTKAYQYSYEKALVSARDEWNKRGKKQAARSSETFPSIKYAGVSQSKVEQSFRDLFAQAKLGAVTIRLADAFSLFGVGDFAQWQKFVADVITKADVIERAVGSSKHLSMKMDREVSLVIS